MEKTSRKIPYWVTTGLLIFPVILLVGVILYLAGGINVLFITAIVPSIIFEQMLENCCTAISDSRILNLVFIIVFWFTIGASVGLGGEIFRKKSRSKRGSDD